MSKTGNVLRFCHVSQRFSALHAGKNTTSRSLVVLSLALQPQPDPSLLNTTRGTASKVIDDTGNKVNVVEPGFKEHLAVYDIS
jgi:hypothetical protein